jgi:hypothetical protein
MTLTMPHASGEINTARAARLWGKLMRDNVILLRQSTRLPHDRQVINAERLAVRRLHAPGLMRSLRY